MGSLHKVGSPPQFSYWQRKNYKPEKKYHGLGSAVKQFEFKFHEKNPFSFRIFRIHSDNVELHSVFSSSSLRRFKNLLTHSDNLRIC